MYCVIERKGEGPVYVIEPERGGERRTVHRNLLFHCSDELPDAPVVVPKPKCRKPVKKEVKFQIEESCSDDSDASESDETSNKSDDSIPSRRTSVRAPRKRQPPKTLNYRQLGTPSINSINIDKQSRGYKMWLQELWTVGLMIDRMTKHGGTTQIVF